MKVIISSRPDGGASVTVPTEGSRLSTGIKLASGESLKSELPQPVDKFLRGWPVAGAIAEWAESEDEFVLRIVEKDVPSDALNVRIVDSDSIPSDRTFRNAWEGNNGVRVNMVKAREIHKDRLRELRKPLLAALDVRYMCADEIGDTAAKAKIALQKQVLRDSTADPAIEAAETPEELALVMPLPLAKG